MNYKWLERMARGFSNHRRIQFLDIIYRSPEQSVEEIASSLKVNYKTAAEHIRRLAVAGLLLKRNEGAAVRHKLSERGEKVLKFLRTLE